jgi:hypothetical protein
MTGGLSGFRPSLIDFHVPSQQPVSAEAIVSAKIKRTEEDPNNIDNNPISFIPSSSEIS